MTTSNCPPTPGSTNPFALGPGETECDLLPRLYSMLYGGAGGQSTIEVRQKDDWIKFAPPNIGQLRMEIRRLEAICAAPNTRARRAGPFANPWGRSASWSRGFAYPYGW